MIAGGIEMDEAVTISRRAECSVVAKAGADALDVRPYHAARRDGGIAPYQMVHSVGNIRPSYTFYANLCNVTALNYIHYCGHNALFDMIFSQGGYSYG